MTMLLTRRFLLAPVLGSVPVILGLATWPSAAAAAPAASVEFRIAYEDKESPDHLGTVQVPAENPGITVELVQRLPARMAELKLVLLRRPWPRCLAELEAGAVDAVFSSSFKPERLKIGRYPMGKDGQPDRQLRISSKSYSLYARSDSGLSWDGRQLVSSGQAPQLVAMRGYAIVDELRRQGLQVAEVDRADAAFRMLQQGWVQGFAQLTEFGDHLLRRSPELAQQISKIGPPLMERDYFLQISHDFHARHPDLTLRIWQSLAEIRQSELERLSSKYQHLLLQTGP